jgi:hypothetical protein
MQKRRRNSSRSWAKGGVEAGPPRGLQQRSRRSVRAPSGQTGGWRRWPRPRVSCEGGEQRGSGRWSVPARSQAQAGRRAGLEAQPERRLQAHGARKEALTQWGKEEPTVDAAGQKGTLHGVERKKGMVEAGGIEPPSGRLGPRVSPCAAYGWFSSRGLGVGSRPPRPAREISTAAAGRGDGPACFGGAVIRFAGGSRRSRRDCG